MKKMKIKRTANAKRTGKVLLYSVSAAVTLAALGYLYARKGKRPL